MPRHNSDTSPNAWTNFIRFMGSFAKMSLYFFHFRRAVSSEKVPRKIVIMKEAKILLTNPVKKCLCVLESRLVIACNRF